MVSVELGVGAISGVFVGVSIIGVDVMISGVEVGISKGIAVVSANEGNDHAKGIRSAIEVSVRAMCFIIVLRLFIFKFPC